MNPQPSTRRRSLVCLLAALLLGGAPQSVPPAVAAPNLTGVIQTLVALLEKQDTTKITADDYASTSLKQMITFGTPAGYRLKVRYLNFGVSLVDALKVARDSELRRRMIEMVQWSRNPQVRAQAIITLATLLDPAHKKYFKEAVLDLNISIRFAAVEALQTWGQPEALPLLRLAMVRDNAPLMRLWAAQALLSLGQPDAIDVLWQGLDSGSWVIRSMSAHYLGDYAAPADYEKILSALNRETKSDFAATEMSIAALKLISRKNDKVSYSPASPGWRDNDEVKYSIGKDNVVEIEPLVIVPPQLRIPASLQAAASINSRLLNLITNRLDQPLSPEDAQDPVLGDLNSMVTPTGFALKQRYGELSYLVIEALAGTQDQLLRAALQNLAQTSTNPTVKASALIALAYSRDSSDLYMIEDALQNTNAIVRMGALEAIEVGRFREGVSQLLFVAGNDQCPALRVYAMQALAKFDNPSGHQMMLGMLNDPDWPARAMAYWYLSRYGTQDDFSMVTAKLVVEDNPFVQSEICLASLRLAPLE